MCGGGFPAVGCLGRVGLGRLGGLPSRKAGRLTVVHWCVGWLVAWCWHKRHACLASASCFVWGWGLVGAPACLCACGGGMLSGFWGSAPWLPDLSGAPGFWGFWVGVGGLVVNCIVDASILL